ncbi:DUF3558 domain-containing protein [Saccharothrix sp. 6-C]|uniref:DUF3558 domain-containing protein n=1 Tax=Saccharothrix sp. 6-C TaxID=2781735 RepID=UPI0019177479|nr:DUF3558 domain-containing protein [Saccharothrix sp. 6-C]QQQ77568.1 DUF3558 domain-containing protein [Saccharothrix sp. 6-C]
MRRATLAVLCATTLVVASGCTTKGDGTPSPGGSTDATSAAATTTTSASGGDVPAITGPELDLAKFGSPCAMLKDDQLSARGVTKAGAESTDATGTNCQWYPDDRALGTSFVVALLDKSRGLDGVYANREELTVFKPTEVAGYPAVDTDLTDAAHGSCTTAVGVAEGEGFAVQVRVNDKKLPGYTDPCSVSSEIAETVVGNLKG